MHSPAIDAILERVRQAREQAILSHEGELSSDEVFPWGSWPEDTSSRGLLRPDDVAGSELWVLPSGAPNALPSLSPAPIPDDRPVLYALQETNTISVGNP